MPVLVAPEEPVEPRIGVGDEFALPVGLFTIVAGRRVLRESADPSVRVLQYVLSTEIALEPELERWYPVWDAPVRPGD